MKSRILYVDDDDDLREIALLSLELEKDFDVRGCGSGAKAIEVTQSWKPDLILLDVMMPGMDGPATLKELKAIPGFDLPKILFCTARYQARDVQLYIELGADGVISKPFDPMTFAKTVKEYLS